MPIRPDLVECWVFRVPTDASPAYLLIRRADDRIYPGLWQPVTGRLAPGETAPRAALREVREETGLGPEDVEVFYDLDQVASFYDEDSDAVVMSVVFAVRVRAGADVQVSIEHEGLAWVDEDEALDRSVWPAYRESLQLIGRLVDDPALARWFELDPDGRRMARPPR